MINRKGAYDENDIFYGMRPTDKEVAKTNKEGKDVFAPLMPVAWTRTYKLPDGKQGQVFTSTVFSAVDFTIEGTHRLIVNAVYWALDLAIPEKTNVTLVGSYMPTAFGVRATEYWDEKQLRIEHLE